MKNLLVFILSLIFVLQISCHSKDEIAPSVFEGQLNITAGYGSNFSNRINDFKTIETVNGDVYIKTYGNSFLSFLKNIKTINGNLEISETQITDLDFLSSLETVNGTITLNINKNLVSIKGLEKLKKAKGFALYGNYPINLTIDLTPIQNVIITDILNLQYLANDSFPFFKNITSLNNYLIIGSCNIKDLKCLGNLNKVDSSLTLSENNNLLDLEGLNQLTTVGNLNLSSNQKIETIKGLENLSTVNKGLFISGMAVKSILPLSNLKIAKTFTMIGTQCENLKGLDNLSDCKKFQIHSNNKLANFCALKTLLTMRTATNLDTDWYVSDNLQNPTILEVKDKCQ